MSELVYLDQGRAAWRPTFDLQRRLVERVRDDHERAYLLTVEHDPPVITMGRRARAEHVVASSDALAAAGVERIQTTRGGDVTWHGPGQLVAYPVLHIRRRGWTLRAYVARLEQAIIDTLGELGIQAGRREGLVGVWVGGQKLAAIGVAVSRWVTYHGLAMNVAADTSGFDAIVPCGIRDASITSVSKLLGREWTVDKVRPMLVDALADSLGFERVRTDCGLWIADCGFPKGTPPQDVEPDARGEDSKYGTLPPCDSSHLGAEHKSREESPQPRPPTAGDGSMDANGLPRDNPQSAIHNPQSSRPRLPRWLRKPIPAGPHLAEVRRLLSDLNLHTVCSGAQCPNQAECFAKRTATFMILGANCTRSCRFCAVPDGPPQPVDDAEARAVAEAAATLNLRHVVITSVTRDDLSDGGAGHYARVTAAVRERLPEAVIEILIPDFQGDRAALAAALAGGCDILNHNVETVPRLYPAVRPQADYQRSLRVLESSKKRAGGKRALFTKSGLMVGLGETRDELLNVFADLRSVGCDILTIGQYLAPSPQHHPVVRFVPPEEFDDLRAAALEMGFAAVAAGPFVRSSYQAEETAKGVVVRE